MPNVSAPRNAEPVCANTRTDSATVRSVSAPIASARHQNSTRNTGSASTCRKVARPATSVMGPASAGVPGRHQRFATRRKVEACCGSPSTGTTS